MNNTDIEKNHGINEKYLIGTIIILAPITCFFLVTTFSHEISKIFCCIKNLLCFPFYFCEKKISPTIIVNNQMNNKTIKKLNKKNKKSLNKECFVCFESLIEKKNINLNCGHSFHQECLQGWISRKIEENLGITCPVCRHEFIVEKNNRFSLTI